MHTSIQGTSQPDDAGKKFFVDIEGKDYPWHQDTINAAEIARLGGWDLSQGVIEIDKDNVEHTLAPDAIVQLKPGHGFAKKIRWQRGDQGQKFVVNIEGKEYEWETGTISAADIARLGCWDLSQGVIEIDKDNVEHPLAPDAIVELKPGHGFAKKIRWQRGESMFDARLDEELLLVQSRFPGASRQGHWFHLPQVHVAGLGWNRTQSEVVLRVQPGYPGTPPYGFFVPTGLRVNGSLPQNYQDSTAEAVPFAGAWAIFSWQAEGGEWRPGASAASGSNLLNFALSAIKRFEQGQ